MNEAAPGEPELHASRSPRDLIIGLTEEDESHLGALIQVATLQDGERWLQWGLDAISSRAPEQIRAYLKQENSVRTKERIALEAALDVEGISGRLDPDGIISSSDVLRLSPDVQRAMKDLDPAFRLFRERRSTVRSQGKNYIPAYRRYMNRGLLVGLALYAANQSQPPQAG